MKVLAVFIQTFVSHVQNVFLPANTQILLYRNPMYVRLLAVQSDTQTQAPLGNTSKLCMDQISMPTRNTKVITPLMVDPREVVMEATGLM